MEADPVIRQLVEAVAREHGLTISYDTYYDAGNWQLSWWEGGVRQAIDVQEYPDGWIEVSRQSTRYPTLPKLLAWARRTVPMFPRWERAEREALARLPWPGSVEDVRSVIESELLGCSLTVQATETQP